MSLNDHLQHSTGDDKNAEHLDREKRRPYGGEVVIIKVGTNLGAEREFNEVGPAPDALINAGLVQAIERDVGAKVVDIVEIDCAADPDDPGADQLPENEVINERGNIRVANSVAAEVYKQRRLNRRVIVLGGDHSISLGSVPGFVSAIKDTYGSDAEGGKVTVDAHGDLHDKKSSPSKRPHGMVEAANYGLMDPVDSLAAIYRKDAKLKFNNGVTVGVNDLDTDPKYDEVLRAEISRIKQFTRDAMNIDGLGAVIAKINEIRCNPEVREILASIDIDGLTGHATGMLNVNGVTDSEMITLSKELSNGKSTTTPVTVIEIAEYTPGRDIDKKTAKFITQQIVMLLGARPSQTSFQKLRQTPFWQKGVKIAGIAGLTAASVIGPFVGYFTGKLQANREANSQQNSVVTMPTTELPNNDRTLAFTGLSSNNPFTYVMPTKGWTANTGKMMEEGVNDVAEAMELSDSALHFSIKQFLDHGKESDGNRLHSCMYALDLSTGEQAVRMRIWEQLRSALGEGQFKKFIQDHSHFIELMTNENKDEVVDWARKEGILS